MSGMTFCVACRLGKGLLFKKLETSETVGLTQKPLEEVLNKFNAPKYQEYICWLVCWVVGWLVCWVNGWFVGLLVCLLGGWLVGFLGGWLIGMLEDRYSEWLVSWRLN